MPHSAVPDSDKQNRRRDWFERYVSRLDEAPRRAPALDGRFACPCCGRPTLEETAAYDICALCGWEDDGQDDPHAAEIWGGPNFDYSLAEARENFRLYKTQYRPTDATRFKKATERARLQIKQRLVKVYSQLGETEQEEDRKELWRLADKLRGAR